MNRKRWLNSKVVRTLALCLVLALAAGCSGPVSAETDEASPSLSPEKTEVRTTPPPTPTPETDPEPLDFTWQPYVYSEVYREAFGAEKENRFYTLVDTVMAGSAEMACPDEETMYELETVARMCFPPYTALVSGASFSDGAIRFEYTVDDAQRSRLMEAFEAQVTALVSGAVREGDSPAMAAVALYHSYAGLVMYDYEAVQSDSVVDVTPYRAIMELTGICQSFAPAYAYLCLQCGIDAAPAGGLSESNEAHEWTLLSLDGQYYYADPTFENGDGGMGLRYFGMTAARRELEGNYPPDVYNIGDTNVIWGRDIDVTDERFAPLWEAAVVLDMQRRDGALYLECEKDDGTQFEFAVE